MFLTGEFSKIARVSKRVLQYYDEIGLLRPAHTDPQTGYRYYSARQLPQLNRILALKDLGLTLDQIRRMLSEDVSDSEVRGMLMMQKAELETKLLEDMQRFRRIESRLQSRAEVDVVLKNVPAQPILSVQHFCLNPADGFAFLEYLLAELPRAISPKYIGHLLVMANSDDFSAENVDLEFGFLATSDTPDEVVLADDVVLTIRTLPAVETMATIVHVGGPQNSHLSYGAIANWIEVNGYAFAGEPREIFIELPPSLHQNEIVMEIQVPVIHVAPSELVLPPMFDMQ